MAIRLQQALRVIALEQLQLQLSEDRVARTASFGDSKGLSETATDTTSLYRSPMNPIGDGLRPGKDLFIPLPPKKTATTVTTSNKAISIDDSSSFQTSGSTTSTAATSDREASKSEAPARRTHRYTITASSDARGGLVDSVALKIDQSLNSTAGTISKPETVMLSSRSSRADQSPDESTSNMSQPRQPSADPQTEEYGTATIRAQPQPVLVSHEHRTDSPVRSNVKQLRYPPSSYRVPATLSGDILQSTHQPAPATSSPQNRGPPVNLVFGKLSLDDRNWAIDAPPSQHKPSGIIRLVRRLSGRKVSKEPTPPPSSRHMSRQIQGNTPELDRTESSSSNPSACTPCPSSDVPLAPTKHLKSRRRTLTAPQTIATPDHSITVDNTSTLTRTTSTKHSHFPTTGTLPNPEQVYASTTYFTQCPHTSPPSHLPLNLHPFSTPFTSTLLSYPPLHLRARLATSHPLPTITIINGSCSDCDWKARRQQEGETLAKYADIRNNLLCRIRSLRTRMSHLSQSMSSGEESDGEGERKPREPTEEDHDLELEMLTVESEIEDLPERQDAEVSRAWEGWARKWGPGTVGIHRRSPLPEEIEQYGEDSVVGSEGESTVSSGAGTGSSRPTRSVSSASRSGLNSWGGQYDDVVTEGRMKLDWIRPDLPRDEKRNEN